MSMTSRNNVSQWISVGVEQGSTESDWIEYQPTVEGVVGEVPTRAGTNSTQLVCLDKYISNGDLFSVRQDAAVYQGVANVISSQEIIDTEYPRLELAIPDSYTENTSIISTIETQSGITNDGMKYVQLSPDGSNLIVLSDRTLTRFSLSPVFDITSATYVSHITSLTNIGTLYGNNGVDHCLFSSDGTRMYFVYPTDGTIKSYSMSTAWDITTNTFEASTSIGIGAGFSLDSMQFSDDGSKFFAKDATAKSVKEYSLSTPWDVTTLVYSDSHGLNNSFKVTDNDEIYAYLIGDDGNTCYVYLRDESSSFASDNEYMLAVPLSAPWDLSNISVLNGYAKYVVTKFNLSYGRGYIFPYVDYTNNIALDTSFDTLITIDLYPDSTKYITENTIDLTDFGFTAAPQYVFTQVPEMTVCVEDTLQRCVSRDTPLYLSGIGTDQLQVVSSLPYSLASYLSAGDEVVVDSGDIAITSAIDTGNVTQAPITTTSFNEAGVLSYVNGVWLSEDGTTLVCRGRRTVGGNGYNGLHQYSLSIPWDITSATFQKYSGDIENETFLESTDNDAVSINYISPDGKTIIGGGNTEKTNLTQPGASVYHRYEMLVPWDVETIVHVDRQYLFSPFSTFRPNQRTMTMSSDGAMFYAGSSDGWVLQYPTKAQWDANASSSNRITLKNVSTEVTSISSLSFSDDGRKMYVGDNSSSHQYTLASPWMVNTASYDGITVPDGTISFSPDGLYAFSHDGQFSSNSGVRRTTLSSPYSFGGEKIWDINLPLSGTTPTFVKIKNRSSVMGYQTTLITGTVQQVIVSYSTGGTINHTFDSVPFESTPKRAIQLGITTGRGTEITTLRANLWKAGTPTL